MVSTEYAAKGEGPVHFSAAAKRLSLASSCGFRVTGLLANTSCHRPALESGAYRAPASDTWLM
jgi:hypothetical protein